MDLVNRLSLGVQWQLYALNAEILTLNHGVQIAIHDLNFRIAIIEGAIFLLRTS